jgi:co-chaperonin GroES (HSP10)
MSSNESGIFVVGHNILVIPKLTEARTDSGIYLPEDKVARENQVQITGVVVGIGAECWSDKKTRYCNIGDEIMFAKLKGFFVDGVDGNKYRMIQDLDVLAVVGVKND